MELRSPAFRDGGAIPVLHTCDGEDVSPPLEWSEVPSGTHSLALVMEDPDAPAGTWVHWVLYDLAPDRTRLEPRLPKTAVLADGAKHGACWGVEEFSKVGYYGPCPPPGRPHRYVFTLYALAAATGLRPRRNKAELLRAIEGRILASASLTGLYGRGEQMGTR